MRKIQYPDPTRMAELMNEFKELFRDNIATMQNEWNNLRDELRMHSRNLDQDKL